MFLQHIRSIGPRRAATLVLIGLASSAHAEESPGDRSAHHGHGGHAAMASSEPAPLSETGQSAFAVLAETLAVLMADPDTDWSRVDIGALREHLVSMDRLVLDAEVETETLDEGYRFVVSGKGRTRQAIDEMVPAHAAVLAAETAWSVEAVRVADGVALVVESDDPNERQRIAALGFFGLMAIGNHHREHHWAMVNGRPMHTR